MKRTNKYFVMILTSFLINLILASNVIAAPAVPDYMLLEKDDLDGYLYLVTIEETKYSNIPTGFLKAILLSPPSSIYDVGPMHLKDKTTLETSPEDNIKISAKKISELFDKYQDEYLVLVNYFNATEEQDSYISDVYRTYFAVKALDSYYSRWQSGKIKFMSKL